MLKWKSGLDKSKMAAAAPDVTSTESSATTRTSSTVTANTVSSTSSDNSVINFQWSEQCETPDSFHDDDKLPCVAKIEENDRSLLPGLKIYANQPLLFYRRVRKRQARARTIYHDKGGAYLEIGQTILIPDDYTGWFELVPPDFSRATCFRSIAEVANAMPRKFFTRSNLKTVRIEEGEDGEQKHLERKVSAGSFLRTVNVFSAKWRTSAQTGVFKKKQTEWVTQEVKYLKCIDKDEKEILVPLSHRGKFNAIYEKGKLNQHSVYSIKDILRDLKLPVKVRLLFGKAPVVPCIFTGMMCVREQQEGDVLLASTILYRRNALLEVPTTTIPTTISTSPTTPTSSPPPHPPFTLRQAAREEDFTPLASFEDAQKLCQKYALVFSTLMKLAPELDVQQKTIQHVPTDPDLARQTDEALRALDLITDISLTDGDDEEGGGGGPRDLFLGESDTDTGSVRSGDDQMMVVMPGGRIMELTPVSAENRQSTTNV